MSEFQLPAEFKGGPPVSAAVKALNMEKFGAGIEASFAVIKISGKVWSLQYRGNNYPFMRKDTGDGGGPRGFMDVVFLRVAPTKSKTYYTKFKEGQKERPICWSNDAIVPDPAVGAGKQHDNCALCPMNKVGSATSDTGKPMKACRDHKRAAVFIDPAIVKTVMDEQIDGSVMLRIPAASLNDFAAFGENMDAQGFPGISYVTRIGFDPKVAYQKFTFQALRRLNDEECNAAIDMRNNPITERIINSAPVVDEDGAPAAPPPKDAPSPVGSFAQRPAPPADNVVELRPEPPAETKEAAPPLTPTPPVDTSDFSVSPETDAKLAALLK